MMKMMKMRGLMAAALVGAALGMASTVASASPRESRNNRTRPTNNRERNAWNAAVDAKNAAKKARRGNPR